MSTVAQYEADVVNAQATLDALVSPDCGDGAVVNLTGSARRSYQGRLDAHYRRVEQASMHLSNAKARLAKAKRAEAETARVRYTAADLAGARVVRDRYGWHEVVRVSAKSVTVKTAWSWTDRIALDAVLDFRA